MFKKEKSLQTGPGHNAPIRGGGGGGGGGGKGSFSQNC